MNANTNDTPLSDEALDATQGGTIQARIDRLPRATEASAPSVSEIVVTKG